MKSRARACSGTRNGSIMICGSNGCVLPYPVSHKVKLTGTEAGHAIGRTCPDWALCYRVPMPGTVMAPLPSPQAPSPRSSALRPISAQPESILSSAAGVSSNNSAHWPAGSSAYPTQLSLVLRAIGGSSRRRTAQHLSPMRRAYGHHRTRLPTSTLAQSGNWARQLMTRSLLSLSHIAPASPVPVFW